MKKLTQTLIAVAALSAAVSAQAAPTNDNSYTVKSTVVANAKGNKVLEVAKFDTTKGELKSVTVDLYSLFRPTISVENTSTSSGSTIIATASQKLVLAVDTGALVTHQAELVHTFEVAAFDGVSDYAGLSGAVFSTEGRLDHTAASFTDKLILDMFSGQGKLSTRLFGSANTSFTATSGNTDSYGLSAFNGYAQVTYNFAQPVPEPETYALLLAGLSVMGVLARRRRSV